MATPPAIEKRKYPRFPVQFRSSFSSVNVVGGEGLLHDLSVRGCQIESGTSVQPGTELRLLIHVSQEGDPLEIAVARVRWRQGQRFGAEFADIHNEAWKRLCGLIQDLEHPLAADGPSGPGRPRP